MSLSQRFIVVTFKAITSLISRIDDAGLRRVPARGPLIIYTNHVNLLEIPIFYTHLQPRRVYSMVLAKRWNNPFLGWMLDVTKAIPVHRGEADITAFRKALEVLKKGEIIIIAPEGTRSHDGKLQLAHAGVVLLALHSGVPLIPVAFYGAENYTKNLSHLKRSEFHLGVGRLFHLEAHGEKVTREVRKKMLDELMFQLALQLPSEYRGCYADSSQASQRYLVFEN